MKIFRIQNVDFEIQPNVRNKGIFSLICTSGNYSVEWIPDPTRNQERLSKKDIPPKVSVSLNEIMSITRTNYNAKTVILKIVLINKTALPRIIFWENAHAFVTHLLEFFKYKKIIKYVPNTRYQYNIVDPQEPQIDEEKEDITAQEVADIAAHNRILRNLLPKQEIKKYINVNREELQGNDFSEIKRQIFQRGIEPAARPYIWPLLFGALPYADDSSIINAHIQMLTQEYQKIQKQHSLITQAQIDKSSTLHDILHVIDNDVNRNDRKTDAFKGDNNPNLLLLRHVLTAYAFYNRDTGYVQGMNDLLSPLILLFIKGWTDEGKAIFYDDTVREKEEAEAFIFFNFTGMMELTQQDRLFVDLADHQAFVLDRTAAIASAVHPPIKALLHNSELNDLSFLFRPILLLFKRAFKMDDVWRVWDSIFTAESPHCFSRFIGAAILVILFPKFLIHTNGSLGEVMCFTDGFLDQLDVKYVLQLASSLEKELAKPNPNHDYTCEPIPTHDDLRKYRSIYMKL